MNELMKVCVIWGHLNGAYQIEPPTRWFLAAPPGNCEVMQVAADKLNKNPPNQSTFYVKDKDWKPEKLSLAI